MTHRITLSLLALLSVGTANAQTVNGSTFTMVMTVKPSGTGAGAAEMPFRNQYMRTTMTATAAGRSRMDVDSVSGDASFKKGEYTLTDAGGTIVVRPVTKTFTAEPDLSDMNVDSILANTGISFKSKVLKARVDSLGPGDRIDGRPTQHYRVQLTQSFGIEAVNMPMAAELAAAMSGEITLTIDHWYADVVDVLLDPTFEDPVRQLPMRNGAPGSLTKTLDSLFSRLPKGKLAVRSSTTSSYGSGTTLMIMETTTEIRGLKNAPVDVRRLTLPDDYKEVVPPMENPMMPIKPQANVARWKSSAWANQKGTKKP